MRPQKNSNLRAFTLIELLVVISIIVILASMLLGGIAVARKMALKAKTVALVTDVGAGVAKFHDINGFYPLDGTSSHTDPVSNGTNLYEKLKTINAVPETHLSAGSFIDAFGNPLRYFHFLDYAGALPQPQPRPDTFRLWSIGPDGIDQTLADPTDAGGTKKPDDIRNW